MTNKKRARRGEALQFIFDHVSYDGDDCVNWPFTILKSGYGQVGYEGKMVSVHRLICALANGEPPTPKHEAAHNCGNTTCVNPNHIAWKTRTQNEHDKQIHGTTIEGVRNGRSILTEYQVKEIRSKYASGLYTSNQLGEDYGVNPMAILHIIHKRNWKHI